MLLLEKEKRFGRAGERRGKSQISWTPLNKVEQRKIFVMKKTALFCYYWDANRGIWKADCTVCQWINSIRCCATEVEGLPRIHGPVHSKGIASKHRPTFSRALRPLHTGTVGKGCNGPGFYYQLGMPYWKHLKMLKFVLSIHFKKRKKRNQQTRSHSMESTQAFKNQSQNNTWF